MLSVYLRFVFFMFAFAGYRMPRYVSLRWPKLYYGYAYFYDVIIILELITMGSNVIAPGISLSERCYGAFASLATSEGVMKSVACYLQREKFSSVLKFWDDYIDNEDDSEVREDTIESMRSVRRLSKWLIFVTLGPMIPWGALPLIIKIFSYFIPALENKYNFIAAPAQFLIDPLVSPNFEIITAFQGIAGFVAVVRMVSYDYMLYALLSCQIVQYRHLKKRLKQIVQCSQDERFAQWWKYLEDDPTYKKLSQPAALKEWVDLHCHLIQFSRLFNQLFSPALLYKFFIEILMICSTAYYVISSGSLTSLFSFVFLIISVIHLFVMCWLGQEVKHHSATLTQDAFWQQWHTCPPKLKSSLRIIFENNKKPVKIKAFVTFNLSIHTFKYILQTAYSFCTVLKNMKST